MCSALRFYRMLFHISVAASVVGWSNTAFVATGRSELPPSIAFNTISVEQGRLQVSGSIEESPDDSGARCAVASLNPTNLTITSMVEEACDAPALHGRQVGPSELGTKSFEGALRIARSNSATGAVTYGPVLFNYQQTSGTIPEITYDGNHAMWVYEPSSTKGPVAIRVSATTGRVLQVAHFPLLGRALIAADHDGLFLAPAANSFGGWNGIVYEIPVGSTTDKVAYPALNYQGYVAWMTASGETVSLAACKRPISATPSCTFHRFSGQGFTQTLDRPISSPGPVLFYGEQLVGGPAEGYFGETGSPLPFPSAWTATVVHIDPTTGTISAVGSFTQHGFGGRVLAGEGAVFHGALYALSGRTQAGPATVTRIPL